jgi:hypothetical protein
MNKPVRLHGGWANGYGKSTWAIVSHDNDLYQASNADTRRGSIQRHESDLGMTWKDCMKMGDRAVKVWIEYSAPKPRTKS